MRSRPIAIGVLVTTVVAACTSSGAQRDETARVASRGTLRVAILGEGAILEPADPQRSYDFAWWEIFRCCLLRTLLSYRGVPTDRGGAALHPDLAARMPDVSGDGLTWTFALREGLHYAPPFDDQEIVAADVVRAMERMGDPAVNPEDPSSYNYAFYFSVIQGFDAYRDGRAESIAGLETPDARTLVVRLTRPAGELGYLFSLPGSAPIPPGAADGHDEDYGLYLAASGPYMFEGSPDLDVSRPPAEQAPVSGYASARLSGDPEVLHSGFAYLVRNPSWSSRSDSLRRAYVDRIELTLGAVEPFVASQQGFRSALHATFDAVRQGRLDLVLDLDPPPGIASRYRSDPALKDRIRTVATNGVAFVAFNTALPPFDDVLVRRAASLAIDRQALRRLWPRSWGFSGLAADHAVPDAMENAYLIQWDPSWWSGEGDIRAARDSMRASPYDRNEDGRCDATSCRDVALAVDDHFPADVLPPIRAGLAAIGITSRVVRGPRGAYPAFRGPDDRIAIAADNWYADFPDGSAFFPFTFYGAMLEAPGTFPFSMLGASSAQLAMWGYEVLDVPDVDGVIESCRALVGTARLTCWTELDQRLSEQIVPWAPLLFQTTSRTISDRVVRFSFDQFVAMPALDQIALVAEEEAA